MIRKLADHYKFSNGTPKLSKLVKVRLSSILDCSRSLLAFQPARARSYSGENAYVHLEVSTIIDKLSGNRESDQKLRLVAVSMTMIKTLAIAYINNEIYHDNGNG